MKTWGLCFFFALVVAHSSIGQSATETSDRALYATIFPNMEAAPAFDVFAHGLHGMQELSAKGKIKEQRLVLIDFSKPSTEKRLWVIDLESNTLLFHTLVAHGKNSGENYAKSFSNTPQSYKSSLGFYVTGKTYTGKHGLSLYLHGQEPGINDKALERSIVMHGADYVSRSFAKRIGRLGRSHGCPAVPMDVHEDLIRAIDQGACVFIWHPQPSYQAKSKLLS